MDGLGRAGGGFGRGAAAVVAANPMRDDASLRLPQTESEMMRRRRAGGALSGNT